jgi:uncharacterized membrane protein YfcA
MNKKEAISLIILFIMGSSSIIIWLITQISVYNIIGIILNGLAIGLFLGYRSIKKS